MTGSNPNFLAVPTDTSLHQAYVFYVKVTADGGHAEFMGPYTLNVGCFDAIATYADGAGLVTSYAISVATNPATQEITFINPTASPSEISAYCVPETNTIVNPDGTAYTVTP